MLLESIVQRRSVRKYQNKDIDNSIIYELLESARLAPSGSNTQPWHFMIIKDQTKKEKITKIAHNQKWMLTAPVFVVCIADISVRLSDFKGELKEGSSQEELKQVIRDTSIAIEHIVLQATYLGLGTCWVSWFMQKDIRPILQIPNDKYVVTVLTIGYPDEKPTIKKRKSIVDFVHLEKW